MTKLVAQVSERHSLSDGDIASMYQLYSEFYAGTSEDMFLADLAEKTHVILLHHEMQLCGFSTLCLWDAFVWKDNAEVCRVIFSGDTIIHHKYWGEQTLTLAFCHFAGQMKAQHVEVPLYWFLISKGYRTYRYLHLFSKSYYPSYRNDEHADLKTLLSAAARKKFGNAFNPASGLIQFPSSHGHLRSNLASVRDNLKSRPDVDYFLQRNPAYAQGDELACITHMHENNLRSIARRAFVDGLDNGKHWRHPDAA